MHFYSKIFYCTFYLYVASLKCLLNDENVACVHTEATTHNPSSLADGSVVCDYKCLSPLTFDMVCVAEVWHRGQSFCFRF